MRIVAGKYRGKKLFTPDYEGIRPTSERAREALFSILYSRLGGLRGCKVLDIFAGTGAFGLEALSRGAAKVTFVDKNTKLINKNTALFLPEKDKIKIVAVDALRLPPAAEAYNLIFSDAPYAQNLSAAAICGAAAKGWIANGALCLIETRKDEQLALPEAFVQVDERIYGIAKISFYTYMPAG
jgi:16S rRNA (guanine966-N2)-methyltransferase